MRYWKSLEEGESDPGFVRESANEFAEELPRTESGGGTMKRRDFLKAAGFTAAIAVATGCGRTPVQKAIPLLVQPEAEVPGTSLYYASTCAGCSAGCGILAKVRDGRPIKLEGNPQHPLSRGGLCATGQAALLGLYDSERLHAPLISGKPATWDESDRAITAALDKVRAERGAVRFLSATITSPTKRTAIADFLIRFPGAKHVTYDALSHSAVAFAHERTHSIRAVPHFRFEQADAMVSFDADFLGTWIAPVEFTSGYAAGHKLDATPPRCTWHAQFESRMSVTGSKADERFTIAPDESGLVLTHLAAAIAAKAGVPFKAELAPLSLKPEFISPADPTKWLGEQPVMSAIVDRLWNARGRSLVISGSQDVCEQVLVNYVNHVLGNYGNTVDLEHPSQQAQGDDAQLAALLDELKRGEVKALLVYGCNPAYELPGMAELLGRVPVLVSFAARLDETAALAQYACPEPHFLETWDDAEPVAGTLSLTQPAIHPLFNTRPLVETLAAWSGQPATAYDILRASWKKNVFPRQKREASFYNFWDRSVHDGFAEVTVPATRVPSFNTQAVQPITSADTPPAPSLSLVLYPQVGMLDGRNAYNPWLHELPDPITKLTWDNCASLSPATASRLRVQDGDLVRIETPGGALELPAFVQPGQHDGVVAVPLGYGSKLSARFANVGPRWIDALPSVEGNGLVGRNAASLLRLVEGAILYTTPATLKRNGSRQQLASTQGHQTLDVPARLAPLGGVHRPIVQETTLAAYLLDPKSGVQKEGEKEDLWPADHPFPNHRWGMVVDMNACSGCSACVVACQAENNIPVVGKDEIRRNREMHWLRIDRYYADGPDGRVQVAHQPMFCQQCENAPCETVCPVLATVHSEEGLNQQIYNRCVGTRYCANNCPYKARRFNWFNYRHDDSVQSLVLNPDVAVRSRGVMEKCSFCVQHIQAAKIEAKRQGRALADGEVQTACQQSCPARAITFGDLDDPNSQVSRRMSDPRRYRVLSELNVRPAVGYLTVVRSRSERTKGDKQNG